ncbi:MAG: dephospho-CoA kinase [Oligosphaeraceae bacterium]
MIVITGGIGAGKSTALRLFQELGARCADADQVAHRLYAPGTPLLAAIAQCFGQEILTPEGALDRPRLARRVFALPQALRQLNQLTHPAIRQELARQEALAAPRPLFAAIPLWYESGWHRPRIPVIAVWCPPETQFLRLRERGWSPEEIRARLASQLSLEEKRRRADYVLETTGTLEELQEKCRLLLQRLDPQALARP